jgi:hypothetical protein
MTRSTSSRSPDPRWADGGDGPPRLVSPPPLVGRPRRRRGAVRRSQGATSASEAEAHHCRSARSRRAASAGRLRRHCPPRVPALAYVRRRRREPRWHRQRDRRRPVPHRVGVVGRRVWRVARQPAAAVGRRPRPPQSPMPLRRAQARRRGSVFRSRADDVAADCCRARPPRRPSRQEGVGRSPSGGARRSGKASGSAVPARGRRRRRSAGRGPARGSQWRLQRRLRRLARRERRGRRQRWPRRPSALSDAALRFGGGTSPAPDEHGCRPRGAVERPLGGRPTCCGSSCQPWVSRSRPTRRCCTARTR